MNKHLRIEPKEIRLNGFIGNACLIGKRKIRLDFELKEVTQDDFDKFLRHIGADVTGIEALL